MAKRKRTKGHTMIYKQKDRQYNGQKKKNKQPFVLFLLAIVLSVLLFVDHCLSFCSFSFGHCIVCPSVCRSLFVLLFFFRQYNGQKKKNKRTNNDLQTEGQTIQWPKEKEQKNTQ
jgi:uncharacterized membrane protein